MAAVTCLSELQAYDDWPLDVVRPSIPMTEGEFVVACDEDAQAEWLDGQVIFRLPVTGEHEDICWQIRAPMAFFVQRRNLGHVYGSPFMIRLNGRQPSWRSPDIQFISNERIDQLRPDHFEGGPDICIEVISADSQLRDRHEKFHEYEQAGVREYWIVDPLSRTLEAYALDKAGTFFPVIAEADDRLLSRVLPGFYLRPTWLFADQAPDVIHILGELGIES